MYKELILLINPYTHLPCTKETIAKYNKTAKEILIKHGYNKAIEYPISYNKYYYTESSFDSWHKNKKKKKIELCFIRNNGHILVEDSIYIEDMIYFFDKVIEIVNHITDTKQVLDNETNNKTNNNILEW